MSNLADDLEKKKAQLIGSQHTPFALIWGFVIFIRLSQTYVSGVGKVVVMVGGLGDGAIIHSVLCHGEITPNVVLNGSDTYSLL